MVEHTGLEHAYEEKSMAPRSFENRRERSRDDIRSKVNDYVKSRVSDQLVLSGVKLRKTADALKKTAGNLNEEEQHIFREYVTRSADWIDQFSVYLQDTSIDRIIDDAREFSVKRPWLFMGASFGVGILLARVVKATQREA
ncbi:MAG: hypothetical protein C4530_00595 [Desulfobacteraceae bacterium]|nr:MAG: hypothetical protein C4530_00595 [Desulfobacteraceae bacterium]